MSDVTRIAHERPGQPVRWLAVVLLLAASVWREAAAAGFQVVEVARGTSWVSPYWGYNTPKIVFDGKAYYTAGLWGPFGDAEGVVYQCTAGTWRAGAKLPGIYQPATLLLDGEGRLLVLYSRKQQPLRALRARRPGDIDDFEDLPAPSDMPSAYYIGTAIRNDTLYLAYIIDETPPLTATPYTMFLTQLNLATLQWTPSIVLQEGQVQTNPKTAWTYPILMPCEAGLHVAASNSPDGGEGNTYNQIWYVFYPAGATKPTVRELVAECPVGHHAYALDMAIDKRGGVHVLHMWNQRVYGEPLPEGSAPPGTYHAWRDPESGQWQRRLLAPLCIAGFYQDGPGRLLAVTQEAGALILWEWLADAQEWTRSRTMCEAARIPAGPSFMDVITASSGSDMRGGLALVSDGVLSQQDGQPGKRVVWSLLPRGSLKP